MSLDWLGKKIVGKVVAIYFFTVYDNTSLQQDNALAFAHISLLSNFYTSFQTTFFVSMFIIFTLGVAQHCSVYVCLGL